MNLPILEQPTTSTQEQHDLGSVAKTKLSLKYTSHVAVFFPSQRISSFTPLCLKGYPHLVGAEGEPSLQLR